MSTVIKIAPTASAKNESFENRNAETKRRALSKKGSDGKDVSYRTDI